MEWNLTEQGARVAIETWCPDKGDGLYKAYLIGQRQRCLMGTLMPEGGRLYLRRILSVDHLKQQGVWPVLGVEGKRVCAFSAAASSIQWSDPVLRRSAEKLPEHELIRDRNGFSLCFHFDPRVSFPITAAFCFGRVENGRLIFSFREDGIPYISSATGREYIADSQKGGKVWQI